MISQTCYPPFRCYIVFYLSLSLFVELIRSNLSYCNLLFVIFGNSFMLMDLVLCEFIINLKFLR